jgi:hypothetical protein
MSCKIALEINDRKPGFAISNGAEKSAEKCGRSEVRQRSAYHEE